MPLARCAAAHARVPACVPAAELLTLTQPQLLAWVGTADATLLATVTAAVGEIPVEARRQGAATAG
jgi:hypothetical protein